MQSFIAAHFIATMHVLKTRQSERGASALEYVGMVILAGLIVAAVIGAVNPANIGTTVKTTVDGILSGGAK